MDSQKAARAAALVTDDLLLEILSELERRAIDLVIYADPTDHETRAANAIKARAIRDLLAELRSIADTATQRDKSAPA